MTVLWNAENSFQANALMNIDIQSRFVANTLKPIQPYPIGTAPNNIPVLQVEDPNLGTLYLNMPYPAYQALIRAASGSNTPLVRTFFYTAPARFITTITDPSFSGAVLVLVWQNGVVLEPADYSLSGSTITFSTALGIGDQIGIIYYSS